MTHKKSTPTPDVVADAIHVVATAIRVRAREEVLGEGATVYRDGEAAVGLEPENMARWAVHALLDWPGLWDLAAAQDWREPCI